MIEVCNDIDDATQENLNCSGFKFFGLAELILKGEQPHPVTINKREQVAITDTFDAIVYHRVLTIPTDDSEEFSFGISLKKEYNVRLRTVLAFKVDKYSENLVFDFANALPQTLEIEGYMMINVGEELSIVVDQKGIYEQEFGANNYEKHATPWNIYAIEHDVQLIKC